MQRNSHVKPSAGRVCSWSGAHLCCFGPLTCLLIIVALLCAAVPASFADTLNPAVVPFHFVRGFAVMVPVTVNGSGPYDFMLDTGSTITSVDRELGQELALQSRGQGTVMTLTERASTSLAIARSVAFGPVTEQNVEVMVRDLSGLRHIAPTARGVLGQNALNHCDFLLDYRHKWMEFDTDGELARSLKGHHVPLRRELVEGNPQYANLAVHASVNDHGARTIDFLLDSGAASMVLFGDDDNDGIYHPQGFVADTAGRQLVSGVHDIQVVVDGNSREVATNVLASRAAGKDIGGLLPTNLFARIYISNSGGFAMFEPKMKKPAPLDHMIAGMAPQAVPGGGR
jgi:predicted aspartyl protease